MGNNMTHASLLNPFSSHQEPVQIANRRAAARAARMTRATRSTPVCANCQSDDIIAQATAQWSNESQEWELANTFDQPAHCARCNGPCGIAWIPLY
jgi:hypothetical protein